MVRGTTFGAALGRRTLLASAMVTLAAPAVLGAARFGAGRFTLKLHHAFSAVSCVHANFLAPWARKVETQSGGRLQIEIFPSMQLGGRPADLFDQVRGRVADIVWAAPRLTPGRFEKIEMFELPFVPARRALVSSRALQDFSSENLADEFRDFHAICFACSDRGVVHLLTPFEAGAELKHLRLDVPTRFAADAVQALGGRAVPMPSGQLGVAIARHLVDGCIVPWDMMPALNLDQVLKAHCDFAESSLSTMTFVLAMNKTAYEKLPPDLQKVIDENSGQTAAGAAGVMWDLQAGAVADTMSRRGDAIVTLPPEAVARWRKTTEPVVESWVKEMKARKIEGEKLLARASVLLANYANEPEPQPPRPPEPQSTSQPAEAKIEVKPPPNGSATRPGSRVSVTNPAAAPAPAKPARWWEFWKSASPQAPATPSAAPVAAHSPPMPPPPPAVAKPAHWWQFWKSASAPAPAAASGVPHAPAAPHAPAVPPPAAPPATPAPPAAAAIVKSTPAIPPPAPPQTLDIPL